jgi:RNA polymerase sigma factor (sigma-70 family)
MTIDQPPDDAKLVDSVQSGSRAEAEAAIEQLIARHGSRLFAHLVSRGLAKEEREEIANETWHRAWRRMSQLRYRNEVGFFPWLRGIAKNVVREHFRSKYLRQPVTVEPADPEANDFSDNQAFEDATMRNLNDAEFKKLIEEMLPEAPADYRELINAKFFCGFTVEEIAKLNEWPPNKVHLTTYRAVRWLKEKLVERHGPDAANRWFVS